MAGWGIFQETTTLFNRAPIALNVRFDGSEKTLMPGENPGIPKLAVAFARKQNPIMGTQAFNNPSASGYQSLIVDMGNPKQAHLAKPLTPEEWAAHLDAPSNLDIADMEEEKGIHLRLGRKKARPVMAGSFEAREGVSLEGFQQLDGHE